MIGMPGGVEMLGGVLVGGIVAAADMAAGAAEPQMQPPLPVFRHSSQPSALGVTSRMPAIWVQANACHDAAFDILDVNSHLLCVEDIMSAPPVANFGTSAAVALPSGLANAAWIAATLSNVSVAIRWNGEGPPGVRPALADRVFPQARNLLGDRNVGFGIMFVESSGILRRLVDHHEFSHGVSPFFCRSGRPILVS